MQGKHVKSFLEFSLRRTGWRKRSETRIWWGDVTLRTFKACWKWRSWRRV